MMVMNGVLIMMMMTMMPNHDPIHNRHHTTTLMIRMLIGIMIRDFHPHCDDDDDWDENAYDC